MTQPSCISWPADRSVVNGFANELPENGMRARTDGDVNLLATAFITSCWRAPRVTSVSDGSSMFSRMRE